MSEVSLKEHLELHVNWLDRHCEAKMRSVNDAINKAEQQLNTRLAAMNEFRESLRDQAGKLAAKSEVDLVIRSIEDKIRTLELRGANKDGRTAILSTLVAAATSIIVGVIIFIVTHWLVSMR